MSFHVGQLVACVDDVEHPEWNAPGAAGDLDGLRRGHIYTIRGIGYFDSSIPDMLLVQVEEIIRPPNSFGEETGYHPDRFRPITEQRLAIFRSLLVPTRKEKVEA